MGLFDSVLVECPNCEHHVEFQSKAGDCRLETFYLPNIPAPIAVDLEGKEVDCKFCLTKIELQIDHFTNTFPMSIHVCDNKI